VSDLLVSGANEGSTDAGCPSVPHRATRGEARRNSLPTVASAPRAFEAVIAVLLSESEPRAFEAVIAVLLVASAPRAFEDESPVSVVYRATEKGRPPASSRR